MFWRGSLKGVLARKIDIFKELTPRSRTYELRGPGEKKKKWPNPRQTHLTESYKNYIQKRPYAPLNWNQTNGYNFSYARLLKVNPERLGYGQL